MTDLAGRLEQHHIDVARLLALAQGGGQLAEVFFERTRSTLCMLEESRVEKVVSGLDEGLGIRSIFDGHTSYGYSNVLERQDVEDLARGVGVATGRRFEGEPPEIRLVRPSLPPWMVGVVPTDRTAVDAKVALLQRADQAARRLDGRIRQVKAVYRDRVQKILIANSDRLLVNDERLQVVFLVQVVAADGERIETGYEAVGGFVGFDFFENMPPERVAEIAAGRALRSLTARRAPGGTMPVVLSAEAGGTMVHEAVGHGLEADLAGEGLSVYTGRIGEKVASPLVTVVDDGTMPHRRGSFLVDDEGTPASRTVLIDRGILKCYLSDRLSGLKGFQAELTGNGRRESYRHKPIPRMTNTFIASGQTPPEDIIRATPKGLFVRKMGGGEVNTVNGDFVFEVSEGYIIENGEVGEPVRGATLTGNGPKVLRTIDLVGSDLGWSIGTCGKDGQGAPVSDAQPTLRIPEIIVGGEI
ncbi:MAG: TldD/PmbA family protein [Pseudomonadota bacterium]